MFLYGWTDVVSEPIELASGTRRQNTLCVAETFPAKETGNETLRRVRVQGKLRIVEGYEIPAWKIVDQSLGKGRRAYVQVLDKSQCWTFGEVLLEVPVPCPKGIGTSQCLSSPQIFPREDDIHTIELEHPPAIEIQPGTLVVHAGRSLKHYLVACPVRGGGYRQVVRGWILKVNRRFTQKAFLP